MVVTDQNEPSVCHKLWSIFVTVVHVCLLTIECLIYQCVQNTGIPGPIESILLTILQQIPILLFFELMVIKAWSCNFVQLLGCFVRQLAISLNTFLGMPFHIVEPRRDTEISRAW